jgi:UDP-N-acetylmuramyl pentapeptide synthase
VAECNGPDVWIEGASFDSRSLRPGSLFVPIVAARDGHDHIADAFSAGAASSLTSRPVGSRGLPPDKTMIEVDDTARALMTLGAWARTRRPDRVVGITGSVGKTSTKDLLAAALASTLRTAANPRSFNNELGLPVTILDSPDNTEVMVLEMGMRGLGEIDDPPASHRLVAAHAARLGIEVMAVAVDLYGVTPVENPIRALGPLGPGDSVLVKGSLVAGLQRVAAQLAAGAEA